VTLVQILNQCATTDEGLISLDELLRRYVKAVLMLHRGNKSKAALALGVDRRTIHRWILGESRVSGIQV